MGNRSSKVPTQNVDPFIHNNDMILILKGSRSITRGDFEAKVNEQVNILRKTEMERATALEKEKDRMLSYVTSKPIVFDVDKGTSETNGDEMLDFSITITPNATGGRRSKTYRTKKGKRKTARRRQRGHRRS